MPATQEDLTLYRFLNIVGAVLFMVSFLFFPWFGSPPEWKIGFTVLLTILYFVFVRFLSGYKSAALAITFANQIRGKITEITQSANTVSGQVLDAEWALIGLSSGWGQLVLSGQSFYLFERYILVFDDFETIEGPIKGLKASGKDKTKIKVRKSSSTTLTEHHYSGTIQPWSASETQHDFDLVKTGFVKVSISGLQGGKTHIKFAEFDEAQNFLDTLNELSTSAGKLIKAKKHVIQSEYSKVSANLDELMDELSAIQVKFASLMTPDLARYLLGSNFDGLMSAINELRESRESLARSASE